MQEELNAYQQEIKDTREVLKKSVWNWSKSKKSCVRKERFKRFEARNLSKKLEKENSRLNKETQNTQEDVIFPKALEEVEIYTNDNQVIIAKPSKRVFDEGLYLQYRSVFAKTDF